MSKRTPLLPALERRVSWLETLGADVPPERKELRAAKSVILAARAAETARRRYTQHVPGCTWDYWIGNLNALKAALARFDRVTGRTKP